MQKSQIFAIVTSALVMTVLALSVYVATSFATTMMPGNQTGGKTGNMTPASNMTGTMKSNMTPAAKTQKVSSPWLTYNPVYFSFH
jgi:predicted ribonuclease toxin of YeeF-YezG toxin-antitoxin module